MSVNLTLEFMGGAELLLDGLKKTSATVPGKSGELTVKTLIAWVRDNLLKSRPELFVQDESVRPGILVLVNDADWELLGGLDAKLTDGDTVLFISTLHGG
jgi:ubiquitin related modifier 1